MLFSKARSGARGKAATKIVVNPNWRTREEKRKRTKNIGFPLLFPKNSYLNVSLSLNFSQYRTTRDISSRKMARTLDKCPGPRNNGILGASSIPQTQMLYKHCPLIIRKFDFRAVLEKYKISLEYLVMPESKETFNKWQGHIIRTQDKLGGIPNGQSWNNLCNKINNDNLNCSPKTKYLSPHWHKHCCKLVQINKKEVENKGWLFLMIHF